MKKPINVLMLGWEYPPEMSGGLAIACQGLVDALRQHVSITLIVPVATKNVFEKGFTLIGLNRIKELPDDFLRTNLESIKWMHLEKQQKEWAVHSVYDTQTRLQEIEELTSGKLTLEELFSSDALVPFSQPLYEGNMFEQVAQYTNLVSQLSKLIEFDVIHSHDWMTMPAGVQVKGQSGKPFVAHVHSLETDRSGHGSGMAFEIEKWGMSLADLVIPVSNYTGDEIKKHYGVDASKIRAVHNGIGVVDAFRSLKKHQDKLVLFVGRVTFQKGPEYFLETAEKVLNYNPNVRFVVAGKGDLFEDMIHKSAYKRLGHRIHFTGFLDRPKVNLLLSQADVYCMPSFSEPFGLSAVEATQFGIPCVISKQSGVSEVLDNALKVDFWDTDKMATHILSLLESPSLSKTVVQNSKRDLSNISWTKSAYQVNQIYNNIAN